jgi:selenocysteine lyase/cysteine desulfurase
MHRFPELAQLRADTPGCAHRAYFNHSGSSLLSRTTVSAIAVHLEREALEGAMEAAAAVADRLEETRADAAALLGAAADEVAFATSGSAAFGLVFAALPPFKAGDRILVGRQEWGGNLSTMQAAVTRAGATIEAIPCRKDGSIDAEALATMVDERVRLVSVTWLPANGGLVNDVAAIGKVTKAAGIPYFVDAGQAIGQLPIDVGSIGCDMLKGAGRKYLRGPRGTALLYVRSGFVTKLAPAFLDVRSGPWADGRPVPRADARVFETVESSVALLLGLGTALRQARIIGVPRIWDRIRMLSDIMRARLTSVPGVVVRDLGTARSGLVSFTVDGIGAQEVRARLAREGITVGANGVSYTPLDMTSRNLDEIVRSSVSYFNTEDEIERLAAAIAAIACNARSAAELARS